MCASPRAGKRRDADLLGRRFGRAEEFERDAVEALAYAFLEETHGGWENNEGAFGEFTFDVAERTITLDYNERFESSEYSQHLF